MDVDASVHWHGILLPNPEDGVPYLTTPPIEPGTTHEFRFPIIQSGTYWYHSHTRFQEEQGVYGSIVIEPRVSPPRAVRDYVLVLSEWSDDAPATIMRTLARGSDWYALKKGERQNLLGASAATYYYLQFAGGPMQIVAADGQDVVPFSTDRFLMAIAETYDLLVTVPEGGAYELRATAQDGSGHSSLFIGHGPRVLAPDVPKPRIYDLVDFSKMPSPYVPWSKPMAMGATARPHAMKGTGGTMKGMGDMHGMEDMSGVNDMPAAPGGSVQ